MLIVSERRRHVVAEDELAAQASFLEALVESIAEVSGTLDPQDILDRTCAEAKRLFTADGVRFEANAKLGSPRLREGGMDVPLAVRGSPVACSGSARRALGRSDLAQATVLADFASRAYETRSSWHRRRSGAEQER